MSSVLWQPIVSYAACAEKRTSQAAYWGSWCDALHGMRERLPSFVTRTRPLLIQISINSEGFFLHKTLRNLQEAATLLLNEGFTAANANSTLDDMWGMMMYGDEENRYEGYANKIGKTLNNLNGWERQILGIMIFYSFNYK